MSDKPERLWAPWRLEYIRSTVKKPGECFLCEANSAGKDRERLVLHRQNGSIAMMNLYPYNNGHLLIAPQRHVGEMADLSLDELTSLFDLVRRATGWLKKAYNPDGFNIGINVGQVAGAGVPDHLHVHIVPRWNGDVNFMPVIGFTKVVSEGLQSSWDVLHRVITEELEGEGV